MSFQYWAKTNADGTPGIGVHQHLLRVGVVAGLLAELRKTWFERFGIGPAWVSALAGLHDVGKIAPGFQSKCAAWLKQNGVEEQSARNAWPNLERDHSKISQFTIQRLLAGPAAGLQRSSAIWWAAAAGCHHGRIHYPGERGLQAVAGMTEDQWETERQETALRVLTDLSIDLKTALPLAPITARSPVVWAVAGLTSLADWIGSDETSFPTDRDLSPEEIRVRASDRIDAIGLRVPHVVPGLSFTDLFPFRPNELQTAAMQFIRRPGVYVIEAPMGIGKTEAALAVAYQLLCTRDAVGIYFALPTQATSNRIYGRLDDFVRRICPDAPSTRLIHANSWLVGELGHPRPATTAHGEDDARQSRDWFASAKRALLAPFGVGTVDQALLSVVAAKHFFVRRYALAGKVIIIDEVHSYDVYTGTLVGTLCEELESLGCTVLFLSATLTESRRDALVGMSTTPEVAGESTCYPLLSGRPSQQEPLRPVTVAGPKPRVIKLSFPDETKAVEVAVSRAKQGACVLWICNTVDRSQAVRRRLQPFEAEDLSLGLLHARFPFFRREELEHYWMGALGKESCRPPGCVLVATQVVEQSVDLDADVMISELAPTDMLLQRLGRLWRHPRKARPSAGPELYIVREARTIGEFRAMDAASIKKALGAKAWVYAPYVLLRSLEVWAGRPSIEIPTDIRLLLEATYADSGELPAGWEELRNKIEGNRFAERMIAGRNANMFDLPLPDEEGVQTRLNPVPTISLVLAKDRRERQVVLLNGDLAQLEGDEFSISTARALHRNLVRVPKNRAFAAFQATEETARYVRGEHALATVDASGVVSVPGLRADVRLLWDPDYGLEIRREAGEEDDEPGD